MSVELELSANDRIATLWLNRPELRNAVSLEMWESLRTHCDSLRERDALRCVVVRGRGGHFSAGADIASLGRSLAADHEGSRYRSVNAAAEEALSTLACPTIAVIEGFCVGGGVQIAAACDLRLAHHHARFGVTPARLGIAYPAGAISRLVDIVGTARAREILMLADIVDAPTAAAWGLLTSISEDVDVELERVLSTVLSRSSFSQRAAKAVLNALSTNANITAVGRDYELASLEHPDLTEGLAAFGEKREPRFT